MKADGHEHGQSDLIHANMDTIRASIDSGLPSRPQTTRLVVMCDANGANCSYPADPRLLHSGIMVNNRIRATSQ